MRARLNGARFLRASSIRPGELRMEFDTGDTLIAQLQPAHTTLYLSSRSGREPKNNVMSFFKELEGLSVTAIEIAEHDKFVTIHLGGYRLLLRFYDGPNALLLEGENQVATFKRETRRELRSLTSKTASTERGLIRQFLPMLGKWLEAELLQRITRAAPEADLATACSNFDTELRQSASGVVYRLHGGVLLSPIVLRTISDEYETFRSMSEAIEAVIQIRSKDMTFKSKRDGLLSKIHGARIRTQKALKDAESGIENSERSERYTAIGDAIQLVAHEVPKGKDVVALEIFGKVVPVPLDPSRSAFENSKRYYDKARRAKEMQKELESRLVAMTSEQQSLEEFAKRLSDADSLKQLDGIEKELAATGFALSHNADDLRDDSDPISKFRQFVVTGGYRVLVGKNAKQNDELTMHIAKKEDIWFHARHVPGSHVVLQTHNAKHISKEAIEQAAEIAAYFSDAKTQKHAPVAYTRKKFVRKPRGAAPGAVLMEKEEVVIVTPRLPGER